MQTRQHTTTQTSEHTRHTSTHTAYTLKKPILILSIPQKERCGNDKQVRPGLLKHMGSRHRAHCLRSWKSVHEEAKREERYLRRKRQLTRQTPNGQQVLEWSFVSAATGECQTERRTDQRPLVPAPTPPPPPPPPAPKIDSHPVYLDNSIKSKRLFFFVLSVSNNPKLKAGSLQARIGEELG